MKKQKAAIQKAAVLGLQIQEEFPEVAQEYRNGAFLREITEELCLHIVYGVTFTVAREAVRKALTGYNGEIQKFPKKYTGLIPDKEEQIKLAREHRQKRSHSLQRIISKGETPWIGRRETENLCTLSEIEFAYMLSQSPEFLNEDKKTNLKKIAQTINEKYHKGEKIRTSESVYAKLARFRNLKK